MFGAGAGVAASGGQWGEGTAEGGVGIALNVDKRPEAAARSGDIKCEGWLLKRCETVFSTLGCPCSRPKWKRRYFVLNGGYLFRYTSQQSLEPKGRPISLSAATISRVVPDDGQGDAAMAASFEVSTLRQTLILQAASTDDAIAWVAALRVAKANAIKVEMGHRSASSSEASVNKYGAELRHRRERERAAAEESAKLLMHEASGTALAGMGAHAHVM